MRIMEKMTMTITPVNRCVVLQFTNTTPIHPEKGCVVNKAKLTSGDRSQYSVTLWGARWEALHLDLSVATSAYTYENVTELYVHKFKILL